MTVFNFMEHFKIFPDILLYDDKLNNIEDSIYIMQIDKNGKKTYNSEEYYNFLNEYDERYISDWYYDGETLYLEMR